MTLNFSNRYNKNKRDLPSLAKGRAGDGSSHYNHNYVDIMFTPWAVGNICKCTTSPNGKLWQSKIENNVFDTLAEDYYCEPFVDSVIARIDRFFQPPFGNPPLSNICLPGIWQGQLNPPIFRCHIIDLSPFVEYDVKRTPLLQCVDACKRNAWTNSIHFVGNSTDNNSYLPTNGCRSIFPANQYH